MYMINSGNGYLNEHTKKYTDSIANVAFSQVAVNSNNNDITFPYVTYRLVSCINLNKLLTAVARVSSDFAVLIICTVLFNSYSILYTLIYIIHLLFLSKLLASYMILSASGYIALLF